MTKNIMDSLVHHSISDLYQTLGLPAEGETDFAILSIPKIHPQIPFESPVLQADYFFFYPYAGRIGYLFSG